MKHFLKLTFCVLAASPVVAGAALAQHDHDATKNKMAAMRDHLQDHHGGQTFSYVEAERLEYRSGGGDPKFEWDAQGWFGGDINKLWIKTEGEHDFSNDVTEVAEVQALWSRAVGSFFDLQAGVRHDFMPGDDRTFGVVGFQGLTPYLFEIDAAAFISDDGDVEARIEAEYEILLTQRLIFQPRTELEFAAQDISELGIGAGLSSVELDGRLRYEIKRQFAPYVGVSWERKVGTTADFARFAGNEPDSVSFVAGLRGWF